LVCVDATPDYRASCSVVSKIEEHPTPHRRQDFIIVIVRLIREKGRRAFLPLLNVQLGGACARAETRLGSENRAAASSSIYESSLRRTISK